MPRAFLPLILFPLAACGQAGRGTTIRNVLLISLDTTRADHLSCYGAPARRTPFLDALAQAGVRFADVTAAAPTTLASHSSLMTGTYPHTHGVARNGFVLHEDNATLAELFRAAGHRTVAVLGSFALERRFGFDQGFEVFDQTFDVRATPDGVDQDQRSAQGVTAAVLAQLDGLGDEPWFCFAHYFDPHAPYSPPAPWDAAYTPGLEPGTSGPAEMDASARAHQARLFGEERGLVAVIQQGFPAAWIGKGDGQPSPLDEKLAGLYAGEVGYLDTAIGALLEGLEQRGLTRDTLVVLSADHGESFHEHHDFWNHGLWLYQSTVHVPLIVRFPDGRFAGRVVETPVSNVDLVPTLCELFGFELPARCEGTSLLSSLRDEPFERGPVFSEATQPGTVLEREGEWANRRKPKCVRSGRHKYLWSPYTGTEELFDLERDPSERHDLLRSERTPELEELRASLERELRRWSRSARPLPSEFDSARRSETLRRLSELGYAESAAAEGEGQEE